MSLVEISAGFVIVLAIEKQRRLMSDGVPVILRADVTWIPTEVKGSWRCTEVGNEEMEKVVSFR